MFALISSRPQRWVLVSLVFISILAFLLVCPVCAQNSNLPRLSRSESAKLINTANKLLNLPVPDFNAALESYLQVYTSDNAAALDPALNFKIGLCYLNTNDKTKSIPYLEKAMVGSAAPSGNPGARLENEVHYLLAKAYQLNFEFDKAIEEYSEYGKSVSKDELGKKKVSRLVAKIMREERMVESFPIVRLKNIGAIITKRIKECQEAIKLVENPLDVLIENIGTNINTPYPEYGPVIAANESVMYFTSRRGKNIAKDPFDGKYYESIYVSINHKGKWLSASSMGPPVSTADLHESVIGLSADGQKMFIYKDENGNGGDLYISKVSGYDWSTPDPLPQGINSRYGEKSISLSADESLLFFVSDRPGGKGGKDIYMCRKEDIFSTWGKPKNLGRMINTKYDEDGVFFHPDGKTLYFSSKGHLGLGGYDIFEATYENDRWSEPKNIGYPINTTSDDIYFVLSANGKNGYYASSRKEGEGEKDIYRIIFKKLTKNLIILTGLITDQQTHDSLEADIQIIDNDSNMVIGELTSNAKTGKYLVSLPSGRNYGINVKKDGYLFHSENFDIPGSEKYKEIEMNIELKKVKVGEKIVLKNTFFDYNKATLRPASIAELERLYQLLIKHSSLKIEISGHTDNQGSEEYNLKLSKRRAQSVVDYLINKGIDKNRLKATGYGSTKPLAPNENPDGSDNPQGRQLNRRTEFEVLEN